MFGVMEFFEGRQNVLESLHNVTFYFLIYNYYVLFYVPLYDHVFTIILVVTFIIIVLIKYIIPLFLCWGVDRDCGCY